MLAAGQLSSKLEVLVVRDTSLSRAMVYATWEAMALLALPLAVTLIGWRLSTTRWRVDSPGLLGGGQGFLLGAFVGVTKPAEQAASPVLMGCTSAGAFQDLHLVRKGRREAAPKGFALTAPLSFGDEFSRRLVNKTREGSSPYGRDARRAARGAPPKAGE